MDDSSPMHASQLRTLLKEYSEKQKADLALAHEKGQKEIEKHFREQLALYLEKTMKFIKKEFQTVLNTALIHGKESQYITTLDLEFGFDPNIQDYKDYMLYLSDGDFKAEYGIPGGTHKVRFNAFKKYNMLPIIDTVKAWYEPYGYKVSLLAEEHSVPQGGYLAPIKETRYYIKVEW